MPRIRKHANSTLTPATTHRAIVGQVLVRLREERGLSQAAVAASVGVTQPTWSRVERGLQGLSVDQLVLLAAALHLQPSEILRKCELVQAQVRQRGIEVSTAASASDALEAGAIIVGVAALAALVVLALGEKN